MAKQKTNKRYASATKGILLEMASTFFHNIIDQLREGVRAKVENFFQDVKKAVVVFFLMLVGSLFVFVGMAKLIDRVIGFEGSGFLIVGALIAMSGFLLNMVGKRR